MENCLGIPFPIVPKILQFLKRKFFEIRKNKELVYIKTTLYIYKNN